jgi:MoaA/NifB/PqqE/SkfB family radical SAM enzyme
MDNTRLQLLGTRKREIDCYSGQTSFVIDAYGELKPCLILDESFGNVKSNSLEEILVSDKTIRKQRELKKCKKCFLQCEVGTSVMADFTDLTKWFFFHCDDQLGFLKTYLKKYNKKFFEVV